MKRFLVCVFCSVVLLSSPAMAEDGPSRVINILAGDVVPNEKAAIAVVEALIRGKYGDDMLKENQPLKVGRDGEYWVVLGKERKPTPLITTVRISRVDARVDLFMVISDAGQHLFESIRRPDKTECHAACHDMPAKK